VVALALLALVLTGALASKTESRLQSGGYDDPGSQWAKATALLDQQYPDANPNALAVVRPAQGSVSSPAVAQAARSYAAELRAQPGVLSVVSYWDGHASQLRGRGGRSALILMALQGAQDAQGKTLDELEGIAVPSALHVAFGGPAQTLVDLDNTSAADVKRAEALAFPLTFILLLLVFGAVIASLMPMVIGLLTITSTLATLYLISLGAPVSIFALNLTTALGLGLAVDYSLLIVSRYREEIRNGADPATAVRTTVVITGRTILVSAGAVSGSMLVLLIFPEFFLHSFAFAGVSVVVMSTIGALFVLPSVLVLLGPGRLEKFRVRSRLRRAPAGADAAVRPTMSWRRIAEWSVRRPWLAGLPVVALCVVMALPLLHINFTVPDRKALPASSAGRQTADFVAANFTSNPTAQIPVVVTSVMSGAQGARVARSVSRMADVTRVDSVWGSYAGGRVVAPAPAPPGGYRAGGTAWFTVSIEVDPLSASAEAVVRHIRAGPDGDILLVGGQSAELAGIKSSLARRLLPAILLIALITFVLVFLLTRSILLPLKAIALNILNLAAVFGLVVFVFQEGHLSGLLGFTPEGIAAVVPVTMFCVIFGLTMDYEVFVLARIREEYDKSGVLRTAIVEGIATTGRIVTLAALVLSATFFSLLVSGVSFNKMFGLATGVAVLLDAFAIRGFLVPAVMRLAGDANFWAPSWLGGRTRPRAGGPGGTGGPVPRPSASAPASCPVSVSSDVSLAPAVARTELHFIGGTRFTLGGLLRGSLISLRLLRRLSRQNGFHQRHLWYRFPLTFGSSGYFDSVDALRSFTESREHLAITRFAKEPGNTRGGFIRVYRAEPATVLMGEWLTPARHAGPDSSLVERLAVGAPSATRRPAGRPAR
jgi:RND superfamily putative drug exporter